MTLSVPLFPALLC